MTYLHRTYLRFTKQELGARFARVGSGDGDRSKYLTYYLKSLQQVATLAALPADAGIVERKKAERYGNQIQKDERFWIADTLMSFYCRGDRAERIHALLTMAFGDQPPGSDLTWTDLIGDPDRLELFFEVNLPAPAGYQRWLRAHIPERSPIPWMAKLATKSENRRLEGATKVDAMLIAPDTGFAVMFEAKVLSDASGQIGFDVMRNQIARNLDVMLEVNERIQPPLQQRDPAKTYFVLVTPEIFKRNPDSRLYGWLMGQYRSKASGLLGKHLPGRDAEEIVGLSERLGWISWEDCRAITVDACPWLVSPESAA